MKIKNEFTLDHGSISTVRVQVWWWPHLQKAQSIMCRDKEYERLPTKLDNPLTQQVLLDYTHGYIGSFTRADPESPSKDPNGPIS